MADKLFRIAEGCDGDSFHLWDTRWSAADACGDWAGLAGADDPANRGGLGAAHALETAVIILLFTDRRVPDEHPLAWLADGDPRGWWGDGVDVREDLDEEPLGSFLWLLERAPFTIDGYDVSFWAEQFAQEALATLTRQGAVVRVETVATADKAAGRLNLVVRLFGRDGAIAFDRKFDLVWQQVARG